VGALLGKPRGELLFWGSGRIWEEGSGMKITCGGLAGKFGRVLIYRGLEKALEMSTYLHWSSVKNHVWSIHRKLCEIIEGELHEHSIYLYGHSVKGTWRGAPLLGTLRFM
jgi:hypothetical protein